MVVLQLWSAVYWAPGPVGDDVVSVVVLPLRSAVYWARQARGDEVIFVVAGPVGDEVVSVVVLPLRPDASLDPWVLGRGGLIVPLAS